MEGKAYGCNEYCSDSSEKFCGAAWMGVKEQGSAPQKGKGKDAEIQVNRSPCSVHHLGATRLTPNLWPPAHLEREHQRLTLHVRPAGAVHHLRAVRAAHLGGSVVAAAGGATAQLQRAAQPCANAANVHLHMAGQRQVPGTEVMWVSWRAAQPRAHAASVDLREYQLVQERSPCGSTSVLFLFMIAVILCDRSVSVLLSRVPTPRTCTCGGQTQVAGGT